MNNLCITKLLIQATKGTESTENILLRYLRCLLFKQASNLTYNNAKQMRKLFLSRSYAAGVQFRCEHAATAAPVRPVPRCEVARR